MLVAAALALVSGCAEVPEEQLERAPTQTQDPSRETTQALGLQAGKADMVALLTPTMVSMVTEGDGCPPGSTSYFVPTDQKPDAFTALTVTFRDYKISLNSTSVDDRITKNCQVNIGVLAPPGYSYAVTKVWYSVYADMDAGVEGRLFSRVSYTGLQNTKREKEFLITTNGAEVYADETSIAEANWSDCATRRQLEINTRLNLRRRDHASGGEMRMETLRADTQTQIARSSFPDKPVAMNVELALKPCQ